MYCENCGLRLPDWAHYCERCGFPVAAGVADDARLESTDAQDTAAVSSDAVDAESEVVTAVLDLNEIKAAMAKAAEADETQAVAAAEDAAAEDAKADAPREAADDDLDDEDLDDDEDFEDEDIDDEGLDEDELDDEDDFEDDYDESDEDDAYVAHPASKTGEYAAAHYYDDEIEDEWSRRYAANSWQQPGVVGYVGTIAGNAGEGESGGVDPAIRY